MGRIEELVARTGGIAELVGPRTAWSASAVVTSRFEAGGRSGSSQSLPQAVNWLRLRFLTRAITNRDRTAVIGVGGPRLGPLLVAALLSVWLAPRLPRVVLTAAVGAAVAAALGDARLFRLLWTSRVVRRDAPGAVLLGEFAASEPGAGYAFATEVLDSIGSEVKLALTVQGPPGSRKVRALQRLYERLGFEVVACHSGRATAVVVMVRPTSATPVSVTAAALADPRPARLSRSTARPGRRRGRPSTPGPA